MATAGSFKGNKVKLFVDGAGGTAYVVVDAQEDITLSINGQTIDASFKGTDDWGATLTGSKSFTISLTAHVRMDGTQGLSQFFDMFVADTNFTFEISSGVSGDIEFSGTAQVGNLDISFPKNDVARYSITGNGVSAISKATII